MATTNKAKINSVSDCKTSPVSDGKKTAKKTVYRSSTTGRFTDKSKSKNSASEADELTIRAWKKTFENRKKVA